MTGADVPVAVLLSSDTDQCVNKSVGEVFLRVAPDEEFEFHPAGDGHSERVGVVLTSPEGKEAFSSPDVGDDEHVRASGEGVWTIRFSPPSNGVFEDFRFDLTGVPALVFLRKDRTW